MCTQGERIKKARKHLQLSLQQLGEVLNVSKQYLSKIEKNERLLNNRKLSMLISKYNINVNYILTGKGSILVQKNQIPTMSVQWQML